MNSIFKNISYSLLSNIITLFVYVCMILVIPKFIGVYEYGIWQLFIFYFSYVGFLHFGWEDGIYLRYAGMSYQDMDKSLLLGQIVAVVASQCILGLSIYGLANIFCHDAMQINILCFIAVGLVLANSNTLFSFIFQMTSRISDYARVIALEPVLFISLVMFSLARGDREYTTLIYCKLISLFAVWLLDIYLLRDIKKATLPPMRTICIEAKKNIIVGSKLMLANIASMLVIGIVRFGISQGWDVVTFGKISLTLSISNFLMVFINAVSVVLLPALKHVASDMRQQLYLAGRNLLSAAMLVLLLMYYPLNIILSLWLPQYADSLTYMAVLFPVCLFESRMGLLVNTYLKAMRQEKIMLKANVISVMFSVLITFVTIFIVHNLTIAVVSIVIIFAFRCCYAELLLSTLLECNLHKYMLQEIMLVSLFMLTAWFVGGAIGVTVYVAVLIIYFAYNRHSITWALKLMSNK